MKWSAEMLLRWLIPMVVVKASQASDSWRELDAQGVHPQQPLGRLPLHPLQDGQEEMEEVSYQCNKNLQYI